MSKTLKRVVLVIACIVIVVIIATPWLIIYNQKKEAELSNAILLFRQYHGESAQLEYIAVPDSIYIAYWNDEEYAYASLMVNGTWVEIAKVSLRE